MRLATVSVAGGNEEPAVVDPDRGVLCVRDVRPGLSGVWGSSPSGYSSGDLMALLGDPRVQELDGPFRDPAEVEFRAPYRRPRKIWGIGLNYVAHAGDLAERVPDEPASFVKGDHTIIGPGDPIPVPAQSHRTTAEAELGLVIGRECYQVGEAEALDYLAGVVPVLDQTCEDILERNPRFLTRAKNFPGFFSFGPWITPLSEVLRYAGELAAVEVATVHNGSVHRANVVANMTFDPAFLISFHSRVMPLFPGDIISPGTPGAVRIQPGDVVECRVPGVGVLTNPVVAGI